MLSKLQRVKGDTRRVERRTLEKRRKRIFTFALQIIAANREVRGGSYGKLEAWKSTPNSIFIIGVFLYLSLLSMSARKPLESLESSEFEYM